MCRNVSLLLHHCIGSHGGAIKAHPGAHSGHKKARIIVDAGFRV